MYLQNNDGMQEFIKSHDNHNEKKNRLLHLCHLMAYLKYFWKRWFLKLLHSLNNYDYMLR